VLNIHAKGVNCKRSNLSNLENIPPFAPRFRRAKSAREKKFIALMLQLDGLDFILIRSLAVAARRPYLKTNEFSCTIPMAYFRVAAGMECRNCEKPSYCSCLRKIGRHLDKLEGLGLFRREKVSGSRSKWKTYLYHPEQCLLTMCKLENLTKSIRAFFDEVETDLDGGQVTETDDLLNLKIKIMNSEFNKTVIYVNEPNKEREEVVKKGNSQSQEPSEKGLSGNETTEKEQGLNQSKDKAESVRPPGPLQKMTLDLIKANRRENKENLPEPKRMRWGAKGGKELNVPQDDEVTIEKRLVAKRQAEEIDDHFGGLSGNGNGAGSQEVTVDL